MRFIMNFDIEVNNCKENKNIYGVGIQLKELHILKTSPTCNLFGIYLDNLFGSV